MTDRTVTKYPTQAVRRELLVEEYVRIGEMKEARAVLKRAYWEACAKLGKREADSVIRGLLNLPF